jgi:hypothetical protein
MTRALPALALSGMLHLVSALAANPPAPPSPPPDPSLANAREALVVAQEHLRQTGAAKRDEYGGHRKLALELVNTAIEQVDAGLRVAAEEAARREREAKEAQQKKRRRRR